MTLAMNLFRPARRALMTLLLLAGGCATTTVVPHPAETDAARASARWPHTTVADLDHGRSLYLSRCSTCHRPFNPSSKPAAEWPGHVAEMKQRARLDDHQADLIARFLVTMASTP